MRKQIVNNIGKTPKVSSGHICDIVGMKVTQQRIPVQRAARQRTRRPKRQAAPDKVTLSQDRWYTPIVNTGKTLGLSALVGAGLATAGLLGGLPAVGLAAVTGAVLGGSVKPASFPKTNAVGTFTSFGAAALLGMTGPLGIVGGAALGFGLCANSLLVTNQTKFS